MSTDCSKKTCPDTKPLDEILSSYDDIGENDLIPILQQIQHAYGYLPKE